MAFSKDVLSRCKGRGRPRLGVDAGAGARPLQAQGRRARALRRHRQLGGRGALRARRFGKDKVLGAVHARARLVGRLADARALLATELGIESDRRGHRAGARGPRLLRAPGRGDPHGRSPSTATAGSARSCCRRSSRRSAERHPPHRAAPRRRDSRRRGCRSRPYLQLVAATNYKQRVRKMTEYYHADRLNYAVAGTPNRLEYDQGFFVKQGDGAADVKPIAHLYKTQVYALADAARRAGGDPARPPTTDTYSLRADAGGVLLRAALRPDGPVPVRATTTASRGRGRAAWSGSTPEQVERVYKDIEAKRRATRVPARAAAARRVRRGGHDVDVRHRRRRGVAAGRAARREALAAAWPARSATAGPTSSASTATRARGLAHTRLSIIDLASGQQPLAQRGRHAVGRRSTARSSTTSSCARSWWRSGTRSGRAATPR